MVSLEVALKAKLPFVSVSTDDPINVKAVLQVIAGKKLMPLPTAKTAPVGDTYLWWTEDLSAVTTDMYRKLCDSGATAVVINPDKSSMLVLDTGVLPTPTYFYTEYLKNFVLPDKMHHTVEMLKGLSLKAAQEVVQITMARCGSVQHQEIRKTRQMLGGDHPGLSSLDTDFDFYEWPKALKDWLDLNGKYFLNLDVPQKLVPRGILLDGEPGVGKSMAAMVIAKTFDVPLHRLDVSTSLNRYLGESESRIARNLSLIEQSAPCVWLLDEAEKLFGTAGDEGTTRRILSQILWWLQYHKSRVLTVMTTNNLELLPKELYRAERIDRVIRIDKLSLSAAKLFATKVYASVLGKPPSMRRQKTLRDLLDKADKGTFAHAEVRVLVYEAIKGNNWLLEEEK